MLCKELQFGDWCCNEHGFPMQITNVGENYAYATWEGNEGDPWEFDDKINVPNPIPITREFLEKNGCKFYEREFDFDFATRWFPEAKIYFEWRNGSKTLLLLFDY